MLAEEGTDIGGVPGEETAEPRQEVSWLVAVAGEVMLRPPNLGVDLQEVVKRQGRFAEAKAVRFEHREVVRGVPPTRYVAVVRGVTASERVVECYAAKETGGA